MERPMQPIHSHGTRKEGITVTDGETNETKKYAVDGIPREYKRSMILAANLVSPSPHTLVTLLPALVSENDTCV